MQNQNITKEGPVSIGVHPLNDADLPEAKRIFHLAFGTFLGLPDPMQFCADRDFVSRRFLADREGALGAYLGGQLVGSNFVNNWGSVGFFGPLTIRPDYWDHGVASRLLETTMNLFEKRRTRHAGLFTFPHSTKHVHLYQKFGFWPRFLTMVMSKVVHPAEQTSTAVLYSEMTARRQTECLNAARELTGAIYDGLDLKCEIDVVTEQKLGDTVLVWDDSQLRSFAVCHCGAGTEAGVGTCYVKFGAARSAEAFERLLKACEAFAHGRGLARLEAGVNTGRHDAYQQMLARGFRIEIQAIAMHKPNESGYNRPDVYIIDDWR